MCKTEYAEGGENCIPPKIGSKDRICTIWIFLMYPLAIMYFCTILNINIRNLRPIYQKEQSVVSNKKGFKLYSQFPIIVAAKLQLLNIILHQHI